MSELQNFFDTFENWVLSDIQLLLKLRDGQGNKLEPDRNTYTDIHRPFISAVVLTCCAIDCLAGFRYGRGDERGKIGEYYKSFVKNYFPKMYDNKLVYMGIRSALVHSYSTKGAGFSHTDENRHLVIENSRVVIDVFSFYFDLKTAYEKYKGELLEGKNITEFNEQANAYPIIRWVEEENIKRP